jgi:DNA-binding transcriptional MerR regulator
MGEEVLSLSSCAERLGTSTRRLRYYLEKEEVIPDRRLNAGKFKVRFITQEDYQVLENWWNKIDGGSKND